MTKDHILPKKWGGKDDIDNMQTMCKDCNEAKGSQYNLEIDGIAAYDIQKSEHILRFNSFEDAILEMYDRTIRTNQKLKRGTVIRRAVEFTFKLQEVIETGEPWLNYIWKKEKFKDFGSSQQNETWENFPFYCFFEANMV